MATHKTIENPKTGRKNQVRAWQIEPREILRRIRQDKLTARQLGWELLDQTISEMEDELECASEIEGTFALSVFENALDWSLGLAVINHILAYVKQGVLPKPFEVAANRKGDVFLISFSGKIIVY